MVKINPKLFADTIYPIGIVVEFQDDIDRSNWLGFTWVLTHQDRFPKGRDTNTSAGTQGGEKTHTLTIQETPSHNHMSKIYSKNYNDNKSIPGNRAYARSFADITGGWNYTVNGETGGQIVDTIETGNSGSGQAHNNEPQYEITSYWKRTA